MSKNIFVIPKEEIIKIGEENQIYGYVILSGLKSILNCIKYIFICLNIYYL